MSSPSLGRRLMAIVYDTLIVMALVLLSALLIEGLMVFVGVSANPSHGLNEPQYSQSPWYLLSLLLVVYLYFVGLWHWQGQTVGMRAWRMRLVSNTGGRIKLSQCSLRFLVAALSFACLGLGHVWQLWQAKQQSLPDLWSNTQLLWLKKS